jgi:dTDP-4-dehydrorhamnose reductase
MSHRGRGATIPNCDGHWRPGAYGVLDFIAIRPIVGPDHAGWCAGWQGRGMEAMADQISNDESAQYISRMLDTALRRSSRGQKLWSFANHGSTICIVVFSATVAVLSQTTGKVWNYDPKSVATILSLCVTVISTVQSKLGFERKWVANRMTQNSLKRLQIDERTGTGLPEVKDRLKAILEEHDKAITATGSA